MVKPVSLRFEDADVRKARPCVYLIRAASATLRAFVGGRGSTPESAMRAMFDAGYGRHKASAVMTVRRVRESWVIASVPISVEPCAGSKLL
jgi:hypothetical protein